MSIQSTSFSRFKFALVLILWVTCITADASEVHLDAANINPHDKQSLQRGAKLFVDYCVGCHSLSFMRYNRLAKDLGITEHDTHEQLIFTGAKFGDQINIAMNTNDARRWFGTQPPDLSVVVRSRSVDWIYTYLRSFYQDPSRPWGVNNSVYKDVAMPHVLWELQGLQAKAHSPEPIDKSSQSEFDNANKKVTIVNSHQSEYVLVQTGKQSPKQFDNTVRDIVNFLNYVSEPSKLQRKALGAWVLGFLTLLFVVVYLLKKEYWRDIH